MREIRRRYTRSDIALAAWDSKQKSYNMEQLSPSRPSTSSDGERIHAVPSQHAPHVRDTGDAYQLEADVNNGVAIPKRLFNANGQLDLRLATGPEALRYLANIGVPNVPIIMN